jgi:predicted secreted Zn-dependent protease
MIKIATCYVLFSVLSLEVLAQAAWKYAPARDAYAVVNTSGKVLTDYIFQLPSPFKQGVATAKKDSFFVFVHADGSVSPKQYTFLNTTT